MYIVRTESENKKEINKIIKKLKVVPDSSIINFVQKLDAIADDPENCKIRPISLFISCVEALQDNSSIKVNKYLDAINYAEDIYPYIFQAGEQTPDFERIANVFIAMFEKGGNIQHKNFNKVFFNLFKNKENYINWVRSVSYENRNDQTDKLCADYAIQARSYFPDEEMFTANVIMVSGRLFRSPEPQLVYSREVTRIEHMAGIYDVDEALILRVEQKIQAANDIVAKSKDIIEVLDKKTKIIQEMSDASVGRVENMCASEVSLAEGKLKNIDSELDAAYQKFLDSQKKKLQSEREELVLGIMGELEEKSAEIKQQVNDILRSARLELSKINTESGKAMGKVEKFIRNDAHLKSLIEKTSENEALLNKLEKLSVLNDNNLEIMLKNAEYVEAMQGTAAEAEPAALALAAKGSAKNKNEKNAVNAVNAGVKVITSPADIAAGVQVQAAAEDETIPGVNIFLDESVMFKERFDMAMAAKTKMMKQGIHFHKMFDDVLMAVMENANPYLIGPSGCGKTYMVSQIASILEMDFVDIGYINEEYDILGFQTANGGYSKPNFYRCYKYGRIAFCDELDNGNSRATVKLNSFLSNNENAHYSFPNGENVKRHANFRIIAAGNTAGNGADSLYSTREKIEESVQQRFTPIYVGYDNEVEKAILKDYPDWSDFVVLFRMATDEWSRSSHCEAPGIITTRDVTRIKRYLVNGSFNMDKILDYEFIQTKDESYLAFLSDSIKKKLNKFKHCKDIADTFCKKVEEIRNGMGNR